MPFCNTCGTEVNQAAFCPKCGAPQTATAASVSPAPATHALTENVAAALAYALGWVTGIVFLLIDKRPFVRFHAAQSIVVFGALNIIRTGLLVFWGASVMSGSGFHNFGGILFLHSINILTFILWILLMIKAYQGDRFKIPVASEVAESLVGK